MLLTKHSNHRFDSEIRYTSGECLLGFILVAKTESGACAILLGNDPASLVQELQEYFPGAILINGGMNVERDMGKVIEFINYPQTKLDLPLDLCGTAFQQRVWQALSQIPAGKTATYSEIARSIGNPKAVRAVGRACAANKLAIAVPCHRVVRTDGSLSGYRWGVERKRILLELEARQISTALDIIP